MPGLLFVSPPVGLPETGRDAAEVAAAGVGTYFSSSILTIPAGCATCSVDRANCSRSPSSSTASPTEECREEALATALGDLDAGIGTEDGGPVAWTALLGSLHGTDGEDALGAGK